MVPGEEAMAGVMSGEECQPEAIGLPNSWQAYLLGIGEGEKIPPAD
jgi:hypothetical protein